MSGFWASGAGGGQVQEFEKNFKKFINSKSCVSVNSGTAALHLAAALCDIKGKEVILPSLSFVSTAHAIMYNGGIPVFVDVNPHTLCIDPEEIKKKISKKTRCIIPVHFGGMPADIKKIQKLSNSNIMIIEDAAHACGSEFNGKKIGSHGDFVCFSFHPVKNLAMPTGGLISINSHNYKKITEDLKSKRWCGISNRKYADYDVDKIGWNFYMNELSAAIGLVQLQKIKKMNNKRKSIAKIYDKELNASKKIPFTSTCAYHLYWICVRDRKIFRKKLLEKGIETGTHYKPIHQMSLYKKSVKLPLTEKIAKEIVTIPIHPNLTESQIDYIVKTANRFS
ncbi:DegT/DnrJ/EryC1/StrS family aminotransferase [Marine Group I thaumarchaeote]|uniref:DegT/DnrJ/EryC1/StrS family aminotransferase n=1 Tax=Marine Group I thaumarchaeote TaxID=2511932 RepID=A0A7K4NTD6_9ARCH|nr:DegT/DnrJ/EryC1/StrS family aminotransferase [Marine Group I thaumarchaeote]